MKKSNLVRLLSVCAGATLLLAAFLFFLAPFVTAKAGGSAFSVSVNSTGYEYAFGSQFVEPNAAITVAWVFSLLAMIVGVCACVFVLLDAFGVYHLKLLENKSGSIGIALITVIFGLVAGIMSLFVVFIVGADTRYAGPGVGAILGGLFHIIGAMLVGCGLLLPVLKK